MKASTDKADFSQAPTIQIGDWLIPDEWKMGGEIFEGDALVDDSYKGCEFRVEGNYGKYPVNIIVTGRTFYKLDGLNGVNYKVRCKIEFVQDGEHSKFSGGWIILTQVS